MSLGLAQETDSDTQGKVRQLIAKMAEDDFAGADAREKLVEIGRPAVPQLIQATRHEVPRVRYWSIAALRRIGDDRAVEAIKARLKDENTTVRAVAVWHLGRWLKRKDVQQAVVPMLDDPDKFVQGWAFNVIKAWRCMEALPRLMELLKSKDEHVR